jgi:hypothetical protein
VSERSWYCASVWSAGDGVEGSFGWVCGGGGLEVVGERPLRGIRVEEMRRVVGSGSVLRVVLGFDIRRIWWEKGLGWRGGRAMARRERESGGVDFMFGMVDVG